MDQPIIWGDLFIGEALYLLLSFVGVFLLVILVGLATKWEDWKKKQPNWKNNWE